MEGGGRARRGRRDNKLATGTATYVYSRNYNWWWWKCAIYWIGKIRFDFNQVAWEQRQTMTWQPHLHLHRHIKYCILSFCLILSTLFCFFNRRRMKPSVHPSIHPSIIRTQCIPKPSQTQNEDHGAITTATNTTTTDADDKTEHIIMTAMKYLVHLWKSRPSTHPSPFPFPFPCEPTRMSMSISNHHIISHHTPIGINHITSTWPIGKLRTFPWPPYSN